MNQELNTISSLIAQIHNNSTDFLEKRLKEEGLENISSSHGYILFLLSKDEKLQINKIAEKIAKTKSTTSILINKLENLGYILRENDKEDKRISYIKLSEKGKDYTEKTKKISQELTEKFYSDLTEKEQNTVFSLLKKIKSNFTFEE